MKSESLKQLESINTKYDVDKIEAYIDCLETKLDNLSKEKESLRDEINSLQDEIENHESEVSFNYPAGYNRSIVSDLVLKKLLKRKNAS